MKIKNININNFKSLDKFSVEIDPKAHFNLIYGFNAVGKTTLLEALVMVSRLVNKDIEDVHMTIAKSAQDTDEQKIRLRDDSFRGRMLFRNLYKIYSAKNSDSKEIDISCNFILILFFIIN